MTEQPPSREALKIAHAEMATRLGDILASRLMQVVYEFRKTDIADALSALASTGEQPDEWVLVPRSPTTEMLKAAYDDARANDNPLNALDCWDSMIETAPAPPSPAAVVDHTEQALTVARYAIDGVPDHLLPYRINSEEIAQAIAPYIADALSERDTAAIRAFAKHVWSDTEEIAYKAGVSDTLERLK